MPPTDLEETRAPEPGLADVRRGRSARRLRAVLVVTALVVVVVAGGLAVVATRSGGGTGGTGSSAGGEGPSSERSRSTASTSTPTTAPTTTAPPVPTSVPGVTVGPLVGGPGPIPVVHRVPTTDPVVFITIDDGNIRNPSYPDHLARLGVPFTSFLTQPMAKADPAYWKSMVERGGTIQTHTISHPNLRTVGAERMRREICEPVMTFTALFGARPTLFRPPYGNSSDAVRRVAAECGYAAVVLWTGSTNVGKLTMQDVVLKPGDIILMHYRDTLDADLDDLVARVRVEGFRIGRLEDYLRAQ